MESSSDLNKLLNISNVHSLDETHDLFTILSNSQNDRDIYGHLSLQNQRIYIFQLTEYIILIYYW